MTVIIAFNYHSSLSVIADCRVTYPGSKSIDNLQKLYQFGDYVVLGFSGPLKGAYQVIEEIKKNIKKIPNKRKAIDTQRLIRCIKYGFKSIPSPHDKKDLSFIVATVQPWYRRSIGLKIKSTNKLISTFESPRFETLILHPSSTCRDRLEEDKSGDIKIIGVSLKDQLKIKELLREKIPRLLMDTTKSEIIYALRELMLKLKSEGLLSVGGLFQCARLGTEGISWADYDLGKIALKTIERRYVQVNKETGEEKPLLTIWEWADKYGFEKSPPEPDIFNF